MNFAKKLEVLIFRSRIQIYLLSLLVVMLGFVSWQQYRANSLAFRVAEVIVVDSELHKIERAQPCSKPEEGPDVRTFEVRLRDGR